MEHDVSKLHPIHQKAYEEFVASEFTPNKVPDELYKVWLALAAIPKKDWGKQSTIDTVQQVNGDTI